MLRPGELGLLEEVIDGDRAVSGAWGSNSEVPGAPEASGGGLGSEDLTTGLGLGVSSEVLSRLGLDVRLVAGGGPVASVEPGMLHLLQVICRGQQMLLTCSGVSCSIQQVLLSSGMLCLTLPDSSLRELLDLQQS